MMFSTEPPSVRQLGSSPRANEETANLCFATMAFSSSSFRSFFAAWDTNALGEVLQLVEIPIAVLEVAPVIIGETRWPCCDSLPLLATKYEKTNRCPSSKLDVSCAPTLNGLMPVARYALNFRVRSRM